MLRLIGVFLSGILFALTGCESDGPAERAGERIDQSLERAADEAEAVSDEIQELGNEARELAERPVDELDDNRQ